MNNNTMWNRLNCLALIGGLSLTYTLQAVALEYEATVGVQAEHSDNILLTNTDEQSDTEIISRAALALTHESARIDADVDYSVEQTDYAEDNLESETIVDGIADVNFKFFDRALEWQVFNSTQYLQRDRELADTTANRERRNIFSTGPNINLRVSSVDTLILRSRFTDTRFQDSDSSDNERASANLEWSHRMPRSRGIALGGSYTETTFDVENAPDIETQSAYVRYNSTLSRSTWALTVGYNESERDFGPTADGMFLEGRLDYESATQDFSMLAMNLITDSTVGLGTTSSAESDLITGEDSSFDDIDIVERTYAEIRYSRTVLCQTCRASVYAIYDKEDFLELNQDETSYELGVRFAHQYTQHLDGELSVSRETIEFDAIDREDDIDNARYRLNYSRLRNINLFCLVAYEERSTQQPVNEYSEVRAGAGIEMVF